MQTKFSFGFVSLLQLSKVSLAFHNKIKTLYVTFLRKERNMTSDVATVVDFGVASFFKLVYFYFIHETNMTRMRGDDYYLLLKANILNWAQTS